jgi:zinc/manganese transport system substrate-binding protein
MAWTLPRRALLAAPALVAGPLRAEQKPAILASIAILGDLVAQIVGERATVRVLVGPEVDPDTFKSAVASPEPARGVVLVVRNGFGLEPWLPPLLRSARNTAPVVTATERITPIMFNGIPDPTAWQDAQLVRTYVLNIADGLYRVMPWSAERDLRQNAATLMTRLSKLDEDIKAELKIVPAERRVLIVNQPGMRYFTAAYGVRVVLLPQLSSDGLLPPAEVGVMARRIQAEGITAILGAPHGDNAALHQLASAVNLRVNGPLYVDTLSQPEGPAASYEAMMRHNVRTMVSAMLDS